MTVSIIGGDKRQVYLAGYFIQAGCSVITYGLPPYLIDSNCHAASSLAEAMSGSRYIISSIPLSRDGKNLTALDPFHIGLKDFLSHLTSEHTLFAGNIHYLAADYCEQNHIPYYDLMQDNQVAILNAVSTAEGAIMKAIEKSTITLHQNRCLVLGYGRCGQVLASRLKGLNASVNVAARKADALAKAKAAGCKALDLKHLDSALPDYPFIFNTVPYCVLNHSLLKKIDDEGVIIDIASAPGGVDYDAAKKLGINATLYLGIPGKTAPRSAALILGDKILELIRSSEPKPFIKL